MVCHDRNCPTYRALLPGDGVAPFRASNSMVFKQCYQWKNRWQINVHLSASGAYCCKGFLSEEYIKRKSLTSRLPTSYCSGVKGFVILHSITTRQIYKLTSDMSPRNFHLFHGSIGWNTLHSVPQKVRIPEQMIQLESTEPLCIICGKVFQIVSDDWFHKTVGITIWIFE